ncbi:MAG: hypothetical protein J7M15_00245, partial [Anaerolineae bacterium]|nr:hypothetical protein [Anaerolineae bacterium]
STAIVIVFPIGFNSSYVRQIQPLVDDDGGGADGGHVVALGGLLLGQLHDPQGGTFQGAADAALPSRH